MRKLIVIVALLCSAASAHADTSAFLTAYCSDGFSKPAVISGDGKFKIGNKTKEVKGQYFANVVIHSQGTVVKEETVIIYQDRVFWPCDKQP